MKGWMYLLFNILSTALLSIFIYISLNEENAAGNMVVTAPTNGAAGVIPTVIYYLDELVSQSEGIENGRMLYDVVDYHLPSLGAIGIEFSRLPSMLGLMKKFDRAAVVSDIAWHKMISELEGALYPGLEIKAFSREQKMDAEAWLSS